MKAKQSKPGKLTPKQAAAQLKKFLPKLEELCGRIDKRIEAGEQYSERLRDEEIAEVFVGEFALPEGRTNLIRLEN